MWGIGEVMAMTATALLARALKVIGDSTLTTEAQEWFENILYEVMAVGKWRHLQKNTTQVTANNDDEYDLPSDYNNFLVITSAASPYELIKISLISCLVLGEIAIALFFWPVTVVVGSLFL